MIEQGIVAALVVAGVYVAIGVVAALVLHVRGLTTLDPGAKGAGLLFRVLITPGLVALWPIMSAKALRARRGDVAAGKPDAPLSPKRLRGLHGLLITLLAIVSPLLVAIAISYRAPYLYVRESVRASVPAAGIEEVEFSDDRFFSEIPVGIDLVTDSGGKRYVLARPAGPIPPGTFLYWTPSPVEPPSLALAVFLGSIANFEQRAFLLGDGMSIQSGTLVLYSTPDGEIVDYKPFPLTAPDEGPEPEE